MLFMQSKGEKLFKNYEDRGYCNMGNSEKGCPNFPRKHWHDLSRAERQMWEKAASPVNLISFMEAK